MTQPAKNVPINCGTAASQFSRTFAKRNIADQSADIVLQSINKPLQNSTSFAVQTDDVIYNRVTSQVIGTSVRVDVVPRPQKFNPVRSIVTRDANLASPTSSPFVFEYQANGLARFLVELQDGEMLAASFQLTTTTPNTTDVFANFANSSLGRHVYEQVRNYTNSSTTAPQHYSLYETFNVVQNTFQRNNNSWANALDFSGMMVNKTGSAGVTRVTAITPHHAIGALHYGPQVGDVIHFCDNNNQTISRTISHRANIGSVTDEDCCVVRFAEPLPSSVKFYKTLPDNWVDYAPESRGKNWPVIVTSHYRWDAEWPLQRQGRFAYVYVVDRPISPALTSPLIDRIRFVPAISEPNNFPNHNGEPSGIRGGDSGGPCFLVINGELILVHCLFSSGGGPFIPSFRTQIQTAINTLGPGNQTFETVNLSGFTNFAN